MAGYLRRAPKNPYVVVKKPPHSPGRLIADHYRQLIQRGELASGDLFPSASEIVHQMDCYGNAAMVAQHILRDEGLIHAVRSPRLRYVVSPVQGD